MPSAPPSSRVVSLTAEPTPALSSGTVLMISLVAGAAVMLMPAPSTANAAAITTYGVSGVSTVRMPKPPATITSPRAITGAAPYRAASVALRGDSATNMIGSGNSATPASSGE